MGQRELEKKQVSLVNQMPVTHVTKQCIIISVVSQVVSRNDQHNKSTHTVNTNIHNCVYTRMQISS